MGTVHPVCGDPHDPVAELEAKVANLEVALASNRRIGAAVGVILATSDVDYDQAFAILRKMSQDSNRPLREIAETVVYLRRLPTVVKTSSNPRGSAVEPSSPT